MPPGVSPWKFGDAGRRGPGEAVQLLAAACAVASPLFPATVAENLDRLLSDGTPGRPPQLSYAGAVAFEDGSVHVCTAGSLRVHHVRQGVVVDATGHHIWRDDRDAKPGGVRPLPTMPSRWLGAGSPLPPEQRRWAAGRDDQIVICSEELHGYRAPEAYWQQVEDCLRSGEGAPRYEGVLAAALG